MSRLNLVPEKFGEYCDLMPREALMRLRADPFLDDAQRKELENLLRLHFNLDQGALEAFFERPEIDGYEIQAQVGQGGMGAVFRARRLGLSYSQVCALKVPHRGGSIEDRDRQQALLEMRALAKLSHPNIARILDSGSTKKGRPFFAMEFVDGLPILEYCERESLDLDARIQLLLQLCAALQYAHHRGVVHRDVKPANVLVDSAGKVKLVDFGIAKDEERHSSNSSLVGIKASSVGAGLTFSGMMTPAFAAPEQWRGEEVSVLADQYSVGIIGWLVLFGQIPPGSGFSERRMELINTIGFPESAASKKLVRTSRRAQGLFNDKSTRTKRLDGRKERDVRAVLGKATLEEPEMRYASVSTCAEDLRRIQAWEPVSARAYRWWQRAYLWYRRKPLVAGLGAASAILLMLIVASTIIQNGRIRAARDLARIDAARSNAALSFVVGVFDSADPMTGVRVERTAQEVLSRAAERLEADGQMDESAKGAVFTALGQAFFHIGRFEDAIVWSKKGLELRGGDDSVRDQARGVLLDSLLENRQLEEAAQLARRTLGQFNSVSETELAQDLKLSRRLADALGRSMQALHGLGRFSECREQSQDYVSRLASLFSAEPLRQVQFLSDLATCDSSLGEYTQAILGYSEAKRVSELHGLPKGEAYANLLDGMAQAYLQLENSERAIELGTEGLEIRKAIYRGAHPNLGYSLSNLANIYFMLGNLEISTKLLSEAIEVFEQTVRPDSDLLATVYGNLAALKRRTGRYEESIVLAEVAIELQSGVLSMDHPRFIAPLLSLGNAHFELFFQENELHWADAALAYYEAVEERLVEHPEELSARLKKTLRHRVRSLYLIRQERPNADQVSPRINATLERESVTPVPVSGTLSH